MIILKGILELKWVKWKCVSSYWPHLVSVLTRSAWCVLLWLSSSEVLLCLWNSSYRWCMSSGTAAHWCWWYLSARVYSQYDLSLGSAWNPSWGHWKSKGGPESNFKHQTLELQMSSSHSSLFNLEISTTWITLLLPRTDL